MMIDREKVLKGLEVCSCYEMKCDGCPYFRTKGRCWDVVIKDALELLKGQDIPRCKRCKHWQKDTDRSDVGDEFPDTGYCGLFERTYLATDFCSYHTEAYWGWADVKEGNDDA